MRHTGTGTIYQNHPQHHNGTRVKHIVYVYAGYVLWQLADGIGVLALAPVDIIGKLYWQILLAKGIEVLVDVIGKWC